jgi:hypothetical protein
MKGKSPRRIKKEQGDPLFKGGRRVFVSCDGGICLAFLLFFHITTVYIRIKNTLQFSTSIL